MASLKPYHHAGIGTMTATATQATASSRPRSREIPPVLPDAEVSRIVAEAAQSLDLDGKRVLLLVPDDTRTCPLGQMLREIGASFGPRVEALDVMIALGTHRPMPIERIYAVLGIDRDAHLRLLSKTRFLNHAFDDPAQLRSLGTISGSEMSELSGGQLTESVEVTINRAIFDYDRIVIVGPTFPHEIVGFSGGNKYLFPGIAGAGIIDAFHWLGALISNRAIIGVARTPVRAIVDRCAAMVPIPKHCFSLVVTKAGLHGLNFGTPETAWEAAAKLSAEVHIQHTPQLYREVISICPPMYPELWTAGKCMYKLEPIVEPGGRLIIYAPNLAEVSATHGRWIEEIGYHTLPYFMAHLDRLKHVPLGVMAHCTHVKGSGKYVDGIETPDVEVILATALTSDHCRRLNLGYRDPATLNPDDYRDREDEGILVVDRAGEILHRPEPGLQDFRR